jgi:hypothetical protein
LVPRNRPGSGHDRWVAVKNAVKWLVRAGVRASPVGRLLDIIEIGNWILDYAPYIEAYFDAPKTLEALRIAVLIRRTGTDIHHIVEQAALLEHPEWAEWIDSPENVVRIPTLKHWDLNAWYESPNDALGDLTPRAYLRGKDRAERERVGLLGLVEVGVLKP